jgi:lysophospholipase L1-like esterase
MTEHDRLPLRVLVKGASTVVYTSWMSGPRSDFAWPRVIERELFAAGYPSEVRCRAHPSEPTRFGIGTWVDEVLTWSPDVIILHYGHQETIHVFLPRILERHANSLKARPGAIRTFYRKRIIRPVWRGLAHLQSVVDNALPHNLLAYKRKRVAKELERYIQRVRTVASPLILVPDLPPPGRAYDRWFPGMADRVLAMNETLRATVAAFDDPDIRMFSIREAIEPLVPEGEDAAPDGGHLTPPLHQAVGEGMADVIVEWAAKQRHLDLDVARAGQAERARRRSSATGE